MKQLQKIGYIAVFFLANLQSSFAATDENILGKKNEDLRTGNISFSDIPDMIKNITEFILAFSASISMIMIIVGSLRLAFGSFSGDKKKAKETIEYAIVGFIVSISAWLIVRVVIANL